MASDDDKNGWDQYRLLVVKDMKEAKAERKAIFAKLSKMQVEITTLKANSKTWGGIAGTLGAVIVTGIAAVLKYLFAAAGG